MFNFSSDFSYWFIPVCLLFAAAISWILYRQNPLYASNKALKWVLLSLRFISTFCVLFLILGIVFKSNQKQIVKPIVVLVADNSQSVVANKYAAEYKTNLEKKLQGLVSELDGDYDLKTVSFGKETSNNLKLDFSEKQSNIEKTLRVINDKYSNQNLGAVILVSDGIYNQGNAPLEEALGLKVPFYTIALGDSNQQRDAIIKNVRYNQIVYAGNDFEVEIDLAAFELLNQKSSLQIINNGKVVFSNDFSINDNQFFKTIKAKLNANQPGLLHFTVNISKQKNELSYNNNRFDFFVEVIKSKQKILLVGQFAHPDLSALKQAINQNQNYDSEIAFYQNVNPETLKKYDVVIAHQLPGLRGEGFQMVKQIIEKRIPCFFIYSNRTNANILNQLQGSLQILSNQNSSTQASANFVNNNIIYFDEQMAKQLADLPPLNVVYGKHNVNAQTQIVLKQQLGYVQTNEPLLSIDNSNNLAFLMGDGFWKWRLFDFEKNNSHQITNDFISKVIQSIVLKQDKSLFRVKPIKQKFDEGENILFDAQMYNQSYELQNTDEISLVVKNGSGKQYQFAFSKTEKAYTANLGILPVGKYDYVAKSPQQKAVKTGSFIVEASQIELAQTKANFQLLNALANDTKGAFFTYQNMESLPERIKENESVQSIIFNQNKQTDLINFKGLFFFIFLLLSTEWFIRKWQGSV